MDLEIRKVHYMKFNQNRHGCKDVFHANLVKDADYDGIFDIPIIIGTNTVPNKLISFSKAMRSTNYDNWIHFYEDDCQFERIWNQPKKYLNKIKQYNGVILPDFSLYRDMPLVMQIWNIYRSRAIGHWLERNGVTVMVNYRAADERTFEIACNGLSKYQSIAIGTVGCMNDSDDKKHIIKSCIYAIDKLSPRFLVIYGKTPLEIEKYCYNKGVKIIAFEGETSSYYKRKAVE